MHHSSALALGLFTLMAAPVLGFEHVKTIRGNISPKSVVHSGDGLFFAQNMMYRHTITVYNRKYQRVKTISDRVDLSDFGITGYKGTHRGAPVEATFTHDGRYAWVSNYNMYGSGFGNPGHDECHPRQNKDHSYVYRISTESLQITDVIEAGSVPKFLRSTPDNRYVLVSNWCSYDVTVIDTKSNKEVRTVDVGRYPRGIAVSNDAQTAYIAVMGSYNIAKLNLNDFSIDWIKGVGRSPRHLNLSPDDKYLYATLNGEAKVAKIDLASEKVIKKIRTGSAPRSMVITPNGKYLYVVNYHSHSVSKVRASDMQVISTKKTAKKPIGITYDPKKNEVWVSCYSGVIMIFQD